MRKSILAVMIVAAMVVSPAMSMAQDEAEEGSNIFVGTFFGGGAGGMGSDENLNVYDNVYAGGYANIRLPIEVEPLVQLEGEGNYSYISFTMNAMFFGNYVDDNGPSTVGVDTETYRFLAGFVWDVGNNKFQTSQVFKAGTDYSTDEGWQPVGVYEYASYTRYGRIMNDFMINSKTSNNSDYEFTYLREQFYFTIFMDGIAIGPMIEGKQFREWDLEGESTLVHEWAYGGLLKFHNEHMSAPDGLVWAVILSVTNGEYLGTTYNFGVEIRRN